MFCNRCGVKNNNDSKYCFKCGNQLFFDTNNSINNQMNSNQSMNNNFNNSNITHDSMLRKAIKRESKKLLSKSILGIYNIICIVVIIVFLLLISADLKHASSGVILLFLVIAVATIICGPALIFGEYYVALKATRHEQTSIRDFFVMPFKNIKKIFFLLLIMLGFLLLPPVLLILFSHFELYIFNTITCVIFIVLFIILFPLLTISSIIAMDDRKNITHPLKIIKEANKMIKGHKIQIYAMYSSFLGWILPFGFSVWILLYGFSVWIFALKLIFESVIIGLFIVWIIPYMQLSVVNMYRNWNKENSYIGTKKGITDKTLFVIFVAVLITLLICNIANFKYSNFNGKVVGVDEMLLYVPDNLKDYGSQVGNSRVFKNETDKILINSEFTFIGFFNNYDPKQNYDDKQILKIFANSFYEENNDHYSCSSPKIKTINGQKLGKLKCEENSQPVTIYVIGKADEHNHNIISGYSIAIYSDDILMIKKIEKSLVYFKHLL